MRYDYICSKKHITTRVCPIGSQPTTAVCDVCGETARRRYTAPAIHVRVYNRDPSPLNQNNLGPEAYL